MSNVLISTDARRSVTLDAAIIPNAKRKYVVSATTATGGLRTWQVTSKRVAASIKTQYKIRGGAAIIL